MKSHDIAASMNYNVNVKKVTELADAVRLVRFSAFLWLGYLVVLVIINETPDRLSVQAYYSMFSMASSPSSAWV